MKKVLFRLLTIVAATTFVLTSCNKKEESLAPIEDSVFVYANLEQLLIKGAFDKFITPDNRSLVATALSSQIENSVYAEQLKSIIKDFNASGIDFRGKAYGYLCDDIETFVIVAKVLDIAQIDNTVELLSTLLEESGEDAIEVEHNGEIRTFKYDDILFSYNATRIAFVFSTSDAISIIAEEAITRPKSDISVFNSDDMAIMVNIEKLISLASNKIDSRTSQLDTDLENGEISNIYYTKEIDNINMAKKLINTYSPYFETGAKAVFSTTFEPGRATLRYNAEGINYGEYATLFKPTNATHLNAISADAFATLSMGVDGDVLSKSIRTLLSDELLQSIGITPTNEMDMIISIVCDALSTINGGVTLALDDVDGSIKREYNYYWDEYSIAPNINNIEAILMADVEDTYIINNIAQFAGGFLIKVDPMHYTLRLMNYKLSMGQDDNLFHLGVNMNTEPKTPSATESIWAKDVEDSMCYMVVNFNALMDSKFMKSINKIVLNNILDEYQSIYTNSTDAISYIYTSAKSLNSAEFVIVFDDNNTNSLEQINAIVLPTLVRESIKALI